MSGNNWNIINRPNWDAAYIEAVAKYWSITTDCKGSPEEVILEAIQQLNSESGLQEPTDALKAKSEEELNTLLFFKLLHSVGVSNVEIIDNKIAFLAESANHKNVRFVNVVPKFTFEQKNEPSFELSQGWQGFNIEVDIKLPPFITGDGNVQSTEQLTSLCEYLKLGLFFPFGENFYEGVTLPVNQEQNSTVAAASTQAADQAVQKMSAQSNPFSNAVTTFSNGVLSFREGGLKPRVSPRGGVAGINGDYDFAIFIGKLVAFNWREQIITSTEVPTNILEHKAALYDLDYQVSNGITLKFSVADKPPRSQEDGLSVWNITDYSSTLHIEIPQAPKADLLPTALADLIGVRANEPFTSN
ncbi:hypothetical protein [Pseudoalteromonas luteoviolacea]|uniref:Uncharacterized protein n=1 Tax=Pseudoalteromonas luteoviolacea NCIMB 1942 TaxID=1365253 RepID=A0A162A0D2_9GAMM|nr:hypothetical protein [Pseudoalteromonas luteoviolacea]KZN40621.1 hypothetical protein N482_21060 [Pseudoalteromonas luteoviolacea NCIMB 1942]KZW98314.1 hypothetical protein JL49_24200 [Pseudoalteromonas luteoviolacea]